MKTINLARGLSLPAADLATEVVASLGQRGSGKSNGAGVIAEGLLSAGVQVIVLDHVGIWFSLRLDATGKHPSPFQIPVLGGQHGDIALVATTGAVVAEALARSGSSAVLDVSAFSKGDRCRFAADFAEAFFATKKLHPGPVQILLEEAQRYVPQKLFAGQGLERMLGAFEEIAEVGRNYGVGLHLISQRPQKINKDVLNLADTVLAYRANGVLERKAISEWVQEKGAEGRKEMHDELPGLARGTAIVWSPNRSIYERFEIVKKSTYDAGATPTHARDAVKTKRLDLDSLEAAMGEAVEEAKANDPRNLRARIADLERSLAAKGATKAPGPGKTIERDVVSPASLQRLERSIDKLAKGEERFREVGLAALEVARAAIAEQQAVVVREIASTRAAIERVTRPAQTVAVDTRVRFEPSRQVASRSAAAPGATGDLSRCARAILNVLAQRGVATDSQVSALSGYRKTSSGFGNALSELRTRGLIDGGRERLVITAAGRDITGPVEPLPTGRALLDYWLGKLTRAEGAILRALYNAGGHATRQQLADATGYSITSSGFGNSLSGLRVLELASGRHGSDLTIADVFRE